MNEDSETESINGLPCTAAHLAELFNLTERRIQQLAQEHIIHRKSRGTYDLILSVRGYITYLQAQYKTDTQSSEQAVIRRYKGELLKLQTEHKQLQLSYEKGQLISLEAAQKEWVRHILNARSKLLSLPYKAATLLQQADASEIEIILKELIFEALTEMSQLSDMTIANPPFETLTLSQQEQNEVLSHEGDGDLLGSTAFFVRQ